MSFLNPTPVPVTLYSSTDPDAPQLSNNWIGEIKTILKACLITGYGGKKGAGWAMTDESDYKATFTPTDPAAAQIGMIVDNNGGNYAEIDITWQGVPQQIRDDKPARLFFLQNYYRGWRLIAGARGMWLWLELQGFDGKANAHYGMYFGATCHNLSNPLLGDFALIFTRVENSGTSNLFEQAAGRSLAGWSYGSLLAHGGNGRRNTYLASLSGTINYMHEQGLARTTSDPTESRLYDELYLVVGGRPVGRLPGILTSALENSDVPGGIMQITGSPHQWLFLDSQQYTNSVRRGIGVYINTEQWEY